MTVYELSHDVELPLMPFMQNCAVPSLALARRADAFGEAVGDAAIRSYPYLEWMAVIGTDGLLRPISARRVGDIGAGSGRSVLQRLTRGELGQVLGLRGSEMELAGNGCHELCSWLAVAGAVAPVDATTLACEPVRPWIAGMAVAQPETGSDMNQEASA